MGRPTQYNPIKHNKQAHELAEQGKTNPEIAAALGINEATLWAWTKKYPDFLSVIKAGKDETDKGVVKTLLQRALGYKITEKKVIQMPDGSTRKEVTEKEVAPDVTAQIFWLKNRQPKDWRDKRDMELTGRDGAPIQITSMTDAELLTKIKLIADKKHTKTP